MKKHISLFLLCAMLLSLTACGSGAQTPVGSEQPAYTEVSATPLPDAKSGGKALVAFFSLPSEQYEVGVIEKGNTQIIAEMIAEQTGADSFQIQATTEYPTTYDGLLDVSRQESENPPSIAETVENMEDYDVVFIGYPIWWGELPTIVKVFLGSYDFTGKTVIPFCTHAGSGLSGTQKSVAELCDGAQVLDGLAVRGKTAQNETETAREAVTDWLETLGLDFEHKEGTDMTEYDFSVFTNVEFSGVELSGLEPEQLSVLYQQARYCQAMTEQDTDTMREIVSEDMVFTHMSGRQQSREEYFADVEDGSLRYFTIGIENPVIEVDGERASVTYTAVLNADAYGAEGTYRMAGTHWYEMRSGAWIAVNRPDT